MFKTFYGLIATIFLITIFLITKNGMENNINIFMLSFCANLALMPVFIKLIKKFQKNGQPIREDGPQSHIETKKNTPTMGGIFIVLSTLFFTAIFCKIEILMPIIITLMVFMLLGFYDDYLKVSKQSSEGIKEIVKFLGQLVFATSIVALIYFKFPDITKIYIPLYGKLFDLGILFFPFGIFIIIASSNALNLTDGLDGLAITQFIVMIGFFVACLLGFGGVGKFLNNATLNHEILKFLAITLSASLVFLWFNTFPAKIFMGDAGSLALGALIGVLSIIFLMPLMLAIFGIMIVVEVASVILQVTYFKYTKKKTGTGKRIFLMSPLHHHFEKKNIHENAIVARMMIISILMTLIALQI